MYVVIENTPGYLPDADEPATFEEIREANEYLREEVERYCDHLAEAAEAFTVSWSGDYPDESMSAFVTRDDSPHDLGRNFSIEPVESNV
jgi:hypothetical protein